MLKLHSYHHFAMYSSKFGCIHIGRIFSITEYYRLSDGRLRLNGLADHHCLRIDESFGWRKAGNALSGNVGARNVTVLSDFADAVLLGLQHFAMADPNQRSSKTE
jgi:hypothetical protein